MFFSTLLKDEYCLSVSCEQQCFLQFKG